MCTCSFTCCPAVDCPYYALTCVYVASLAVPQEDKFKSYFNDLSYALKEYARISKMIIPVTVNLLKPHIADMEFKLV